MVTRAERREKGWAAIIEAARKVRAAMLEYGVRDEKGALMPPYLGWVLQLDRDIAQAEKWDRDPGFQQMKGGD